MEMTFSIPGTLGNDKGPESDGVLVGQMTAIAPTKVYTRTHTGAGLCRVDDGGVFTNETTPFNEATADDVEVLPATPAQNDAAYFGLAAGPFSQVDLNITTQGDGAWTITWEYWDGAAWTEIDGLTDGTTGFTAATGVRTVSFDPPEDWASVAVDSVTAYWIRARVSAYTSVATAPQVGQGWIKAVTPTDTDDTTDFGDADAGDVALLPTYLFVDDGIFIGHSEKFCMIKTTTSQARTGSATLVPHYWDGSDWSPLDTYADDSAGWSGSPGTHVLHFVPPADWAINTTDDGPGGQAGYFIAILCTAKTSYTAQPLATRGWVFPLKTGASGVPAANRATRYRATFSAHTKSATNADSVFLLVNARTGKTVAFTWTKGDPLVTQSGRFSTYKGDGLLLVQIIEDGSTEFAGALVNLELDP